MFKLSDNFKEIIVDEGSVIEKNAPDAWKRFTSSLPETVSVKLQIKISLFSGWDVFFILGHFWHLILKNRHVSRLFLTHLQGMTKYRKGGVYIVRDILETFVKIRISSDKASRWLVTNRLIRRNSFGKTATKQ